MFFCIQGFYPGTIFEATEPQLPKSDKLFANEPLGYRQGDSLLLHAVHVLRGGCFEAGSGCSRYNGVYLDGQGWLPLHWRKHALLRDRPLHRTVFQTLQVGTVRFSPS